jgi:hypothetical protein
MGGSRHPHSRFRRGNRSGSCVGSISYMFSHTQSSSETALELVSLVTEVGLAHATCGSLAW